MRRYAGIAVVLCTSAFGATFEVASIKLHEGPTPRILDFSSLGPLVKLEAYTIQGLIQEAYHVKAYQIAYPQADNTFYDIVARAPGDDILTRDQFRPLLQSLLADRFGLKFHHEMREMPVYALVPGKVGPKFKESPPDAPDSDQFYPKDQFYGNGRGWRIALSRGTMEGLADAIASTSGLDLPVVDRTGLTGVYDLRIAYMTEETIANDPGPSDIGVFDAVLNIGLKLEMQKANVEVLVVDHVGKPSAN
jgi:uncharacterized protein (TIGR03435 family)